MFTDEDCDNPVNDIASVFTTRGPPLAVIRDVYRTETLTSGSMMASRVQLAGHGCFLIAVTKLDFKRDLSNLTARVGFFYYFLRIKVTIFLSQIVSPEGSDVLLFLPELIHADLSISRSQKFYICCSLITNDGYTKQLL